MVTPLKKTSADIVERIKWLEDHGDVFGAELQDLIVFLPFDDAKQFLVEGATREKWAEDLVAPTEHYVLKKIREYLPFAWEKANGCRGLSAQRSVSHMRAWFWLLDSEAVDRWPEFEYYGKPILVACSEHPMVGFDWRSHDDGEWTNYEGEPGITAEEALR